MPVTTAVITAARNQKQELVATMDATETNIIATHDDAWHTTNENIRPAITAAVTAETLHDRNRHTREAATIAAHHYDIARTATVTIINEQIPAIVAAALDHQHKLVRYQSTTTKWVHAPTSALQAMIRRTRETIHQRLWHLTPTMERIMKAELIHGINLGLNPNDIARNILEATEDAFNGGLARATNIARTETIDAYRRAAYETWQMNRGVMRGWYWFCTFGPRTCPACMSMHGTFHSIDDPGPDGHPSCRCTSIPAVKSWDNAGNEIDVDDDIPDAEDWFNNQGRDIQEGILGPKRYDAWKAGQYPMQDWAVEKQTKGWRRSYVTSPCPDFEDA